MNEVREKGAGNLNLKGWFHNLTNKETPSLSDTKLADNIEFIDNEGKYLETVVSSFRDKSGLVHYRGEGYTVENSFAFAIGDLVNDDNLIEKCTYSIKVLKRMRAPKKSKLATLIAQMIKMIGHVSDYINGMRRDMHKGTSGHAAIQMYWRSEKAIKDFKVEKVYTVALVNADEPLVK
ncbi:hypothetical protein [Fructilactobacillus fructivorans]|uniref:Uncharacterized protein n=1 Tax=Fructilactobacillus fructivorans TaxID=1614 RepID=A0A0C1PND2_9LACO|nr:hypothetical protein [Fructilactobacillus fructivorans]KID42232.1 hypothetical protein LfDm3_0161 [Fructilactobacillus fructivorans]MCT0151142.1 hypothetical protein [Fructilactobacillus fructivorans]MCT2867300.1 hypothetical protein [Fructilactobacillus fructivorans]MCT2869180.1 hypothetical protein [Fructilactobacillus fructivorans]MCT2873099.1 hypothetical protein [Fructilactobacillus fructivorans]